MTAIGAAGQLPERDGKARRSAAGETCGHLVFGHGGRRGQVLSQLAQRAVLLRPSVGHRALRRPCVRRLHAAMDQFNDAFDAVSAALAVVRIGPEHSVFSSARHEWSRRWARRRRGLLSSAARRRPVGRGSRWRGGVLPRWCWGWVVVPPRQLPCQCAGDYQERTRAGVCLIHGLTRQPADEDRGWLPVGLRARSGCPLVVGRAGAIPGCRRRQWHPRSCGPGHARSRRWRC